MNKIVLFGDSITYGKWDNEEGHEVLTTLILTSINKYLS